jgi:hypothetical protein
MAQFYRTISINFWKEKNLPDSWNVHLNDENVKRQTFLQTSCNLENSKYDRCE